jgi:hypothetical protein
MQRNEKPTQLNPEGVEPQTDIFLRNQFDFP